MTALRETFAGPALDPRLSWFCEPARWQLGAGGLRLETDAHTDYWQRTHYGFEVDNGHFLSLAAEGDFVLTTQVTSRGLHQYDQAGLMVRVSPRCWLKTSVEFEPHGSNRLGAVVTNAQYSDWSTQPLAKDVTTVWFRISAVAGDYLVESSFDGVQWEQIRLARLLEPGPVQCGLYACSPKAAGYAAEFAFLDYSPPTK